VVKGGVTDWSNEQAEAMGFKVGDRVVYSVFETYAEYTVCVYRYICMYVCIYIYMYMYMYICMYILYRVAYSVFEIYAEYTAHTHTRTHWHAHARMHTHARTPYADADGSDLNTSLQTILNTEILTSKLT
jgi:hypothetical protein